MSQALVSSHKVTAVLSVAVVVAVLFAVFLWFFVDVEPVRTPILNIEELPSTQMQSASDINEVLARPLFWHGRQASVVLEEGGAEPEDVVVSPLKAIKLLGIVLTGDIRTAILEVEGKVVSVHAGLPVQGWTVEKVTAKEVVFVAGTDQTSLSLERVRPASILLEAIK